MSSRTILLVEDDPRIRGFVSKALRAGTSADVLEAEDSRTALGRAGGQKIDVLVSDINLSAETSGIDVAREVEAQNPSVRVLLMSAQENRPRNIPPGWNFISKPFALAAFLSCVNQLIGH